MNCRALASMALLFTLAACSDSAVSAPDATIPTSAPPDATIPASAPSVPASPGVGDTGEPFPYSVDPLAIEPGTYRIAQSAWSVADFTVTFPPGWTVQYGHVFHKNADTDEELGFYGVLVDEIYADACEGETGAFLEPGPSVDDLATALLQQPGPEAAGPTDTTFGGYPASRVDLTIPAALDLQACSFGDVGLQIWYSPPADKYFVLLADETASVFILDVDGRRQVFLADHAIAASEEDVAELQAVLDSVRIEP